MTYPLVTVDIAEAMYSNSRPFRVRLVYEGKDPDNPSAWLRYWWMILYDGTPWGEMRTAEGHIGERASAGGVHDSAKALEMARKRLASGYTYEPGTSRFVPPTSPLDRTRLTGPYKDIRTIRKTDDEYKAYDGEGRYLLDLTAEGADVLLETDPFRIEMIDAESER